MPVLPVPREGFFFLDIFKLRKRGSNKDSEKIRQYCRLIIGKYFGQIDRYCVCQPIYRQKFSAVQSDFESSALLLREENEKKMEEMKKKAEEEEMRKLKEVEEKTKKMEAERNAATKNEDDSDFEDLDDLLDDICIHPSMLKKPEPEVTQEDARRASEKFAAAKAEEAKEKRVKEKWFTNSDKNGNHGDEEEGEEE